MNEGKKLPELPAGIKREIAEEADVSQSTVSKTLAGSRSNELVLRITKRKIRQLIRIYEQAVAML